MNFSSSPSLNQRQPMLQLLVVLVLLIFAFFVDFEEAFEFRHAAGGAEHVCRAILALGSHIDGGLIEHGRHHLRRHEAHPDQPVQLQLVFCRNGAIDSGVRIADVGRMASCASCASFLLL